MSSGGLKTGIKVSVLAALLSLAARADTIHLKNGRVIRADAVREKGDRLEYDIGEDTYAILRSSIEKIETGVGVPPPRAAVAVPQIEIKSESSLPAPAEPEKITEESIETIARYNSPKLTASALLYLAHQEQIQGKLQPAREHLERALSLVPDDPTLLTHYVSVLLQAERAPIAQRYAEDAVRVAPDSAIAHKLLGYAYFKNNDSRHAIEEWKKGQGIEADSNTEQALALATREQKTEADFRQEESTHFALRFEGGKTSEGLRREVLDTLEHHYNDLVRDLGLVPRDTIAVVLYTNQAYFDVTQAPSWTGAVNDGKLRIPVEGLEHVTPEMARVLKHELAHSFINQASRGRCPQWLNEGLAQLMEPRSAHSMLHALAASYSAGTQPPLKSLEGSFMNFSNQQATMAYGESLAVVEYIREYYGLYSLVDVLKRMGDGASPEEAMKAALHSDYAQLEREFSDHLRRSGGD
jgi:tetratricopeptide (TPR) repeat protein